MKTIKANVFGAMMIASAGLIAQSAAVAGTPPEVDFSSLSGAPGDTLSVIVTFSSPSVDVASWQADVQYPRDSLEIVSFTECPTTTGPVASPGTIQCAAEADGQFDVFRVGMFTVPSAAIGDGNVAEYEFTIPLSTPPGVYDLVVDDLAFFAPDGSDITSSAVVLAGEVTVTAPAGQGFYTSVPAPGETITFNPAVIGSPAAPDQVIQVGNASPDTAFDVTGVSVASPLGNADAFPITVAAGGNEDVTFSCTPTTRGVQMGTFDILHDSVGGAPSPVEYNFECTGLSPNVQVPAGPIALAGLTVDPDPTANITVTNPQDGFTSDANNVTATAGAGDAEITVTTGGPTNIAPDSSFDFVVSCDSTAAGSFSRTIDFTWDEPGVPRGGMGMASVQVNCDITDAVPSFDSAPAAPGPLNFGTVTNGVTSPAIGIDVTNDGIGPSPDSDLTIASAVASDAQYSVNLINSGPFIVGDAADGVDDIEVTCTPDPGTNGPLPAATLTVTHNGDDSPTVFDLECAGEPDGAFASTPAPGGLLNLGVVPPNTTTPEGFIDFSNTGMVDQIDVSCTFDDPDGVFDFSPNPLDFNLGPGETESAGFQCTPTAPQTFQGTLSCDITGDQMTTSAEYTVTCQGQPLVVPTMNQWGLIIMSLILLMVGGLVGRRWFAAQS